MAGGGRGRFALAFPTFEKVDQKPIDDFRLLFMRQTARRMRMRFMIDSPISDPVSAFNDVNIYRLGISLLSSIRAIKPVAQIKIFDGAARNPHVRLLSGGRG
jgi:hypothetical protein